MLEHGIATIKIKIKVYSTILYMGRLAMYHTCTPPYIDSDLDLDRRIDRDLDLCMERDF